VAGVQLDGGQHGVTAGGSGHSGGSSGVGDGGSGVVEGEASGVGVVQRETSGIGVGKAGNSGSSNHGGGSLLISGPLAVKGRVSVGDDGSSGDLVGDLSGRDHIRLDNRDVGDSANGGEGGESSGKTSGVGKSSIAGIAQTAKENLGVSLSGPLAVKGRVSIGDDGTSGDLVGDLSGSDHIRLDNRGVGDSANGGEGGEGSSVGKTSIAGIGQNDLGVSLSLLPLRSSGGGSIESSLELSLGGDNLSGVLDRSRALKVKDRGDKGSDLGGSRGDGSHGEVGSGDSEAVHGVGHIVDSLEEAIGVDVLVTAGGHSEGVPGLGLG